MRFTLSSLLLAGIATALPRNVARSSETVAITDLAVRTPYGSTEVASASFQINGEVACSATNPGLNWTVFSCGETKYRFALGPGTQETYGLRIYHETGLAAGLYGTGDVFTYCHAAGNNFETCNQLTPTTIEITA